MLADVLEGEIFLQNFPSIITAHALGKYCYILFCVAYSQFSHELLPLKLPIYPINLLVEVPVYPFT